MIKLSFTSSPSVFTAVLDPFLISIRDPSTNPRRRSVPFGCLLTGVRHFTPNRRKMRRSAHPSTTRTTRVKAAIPMLYASRTENHNKYNNHIRGWWKQYRDFSSLKKYVVHLLLQIYFYNTNIVSMNLDLIKKQIFSFFDIDYCDNWDYSGRPPPIHTL